MNGSFILRGCSCTNVLTSSPMFSTDVSLLHGSLSIFIKHNELSLDSVMVVLLDELQLTETSLALTRGDWQSQCYLEEDRQVWVGDSATFL